MSLSWVIYRVIRKDVELKIQWRWGRPGLTSNLFLVRFSVGPWYLCNQTEIHWSPFWETTGTDKSRVRDLYSIQNGTRSVDVLTQLLTRSGLKRVSLLDSWRTLGVRVEEWGKMETKGTHTPLEIRVSRLMLTLSSATSFWGSTTSVHDSTSTPLTPIPTSRDVSRFYCHCSHKGGGRGRVKNGGGPNPE